MALGEALIILLLIALNGFFAMAELAVVSARKGRLRQMAEAGQRGAATALRLAEQPGRFLSTVQIGITLIGILAGAFGGATLAQPLGVWLAAAFPAIAAHSASLALGLVVATITYLSLIVGELAPKHLALRDPERLAAAAAWPLWVMAWIGSPLVWLLDLSTRAVLRLLGGSSIPKQRVTDEEIKALLTEAAAAGVVERAEQAMISGVMRLADRPVGAVMTPRPAIVWLDLDDSPVVLLNTIRAHRFPRFPAGRGAIDEVQGVIRAKDVLDCYLAGREPDFDALLQDTPVVHESTDALQVLDVLKQSPARLALVRDEYGGLEGLVTLTDLMEAIVGALAEPRATAEPPVVRREDGSWLVDGGLPLDQLWELLNPREIPPENGYYTLAGLVLARLGEVPVTGQWFVWGDYQFEVVDMDGPRIDKVLVSRKSTA
ncbi:MAG: hemolysin family protein [Candidatus Contendobacter sp.]|nr:hemolysin family protein [Candidatus Contendobacter sp.]MDG4556947.1 hemolysin family protein [Candidatus Contendobacter sp.]